MSYHNKWCPIGRNLAALAFCWMCWSCLVAGVHSCKGLSTGLGDITPDKEILVGEELSLECSLHNNTILYENKAYQVNSSMISFKFNKEFRQDRVRLVNSRVARYVVPRASVDDTGTYYCLLNISDLTSRALVCLSHVKVGYKPQPVKDFKCVALYYQKLHCSWSPPYNPIATRYELEDRIHKSDALDYPGPIRKCGNSSETSCEWTVETQPPYRNTALNFYLVLVGRNQFGNSTQLFTIDHYSIIKPTKPKSFRTVTVTTSNVSLSWAPPDFIEYDDELMENIVYEIRYTPDMPSQPHSHWVIIEGIRSSDYRLSKLYPFMRYNVSVRCKTVQSKGDQFWSDFASILVTTKQDVPYLAPELIPESFQTDKNMEGLRSITLFWKAIPSEYQNGKDFHYLIEHQRIDKRDKRDSHYYNEIDDNPIRTTNTSYTFNHMRTDRAYSFTILGENARGKSYNYSTIIVESNELIPHKPANIDVYSFGGGRYEVQWTSPRLTATSGSIVNYTIFWCQNLRPRPFPCEGPIDWVHTKNHSIALELPDIATNYQFAVSANTKTSSSGMSWAECIVPINGRLDKLSDVSLKVVNSTSINVAWKLNCPAQRRVVEGYKINYCVLQDSKCSGKCSQMNYVETGNAAESIVITDLEPFTTYKVTVLAYSDLGFSEESDHKCDKTQVSSPRDAPSHLELVNKTEKTISISWATPMTPNGIIDHYKIFTNETATSFIVSAVDYCNSNSCSYEMKGLRSYRTYDIKVNACHNEIFCSPPSPNLVVRTLESHPFQMVPPRSEVLNSTAVRIVWSPPIVANGPINYYSLKLIRSNNLTQFYNISGNFQEFELILDCDSIVDQSTTYKPRYSVQIAAVNVRNDTIFTSPYSETTNLNGCLIPGAVSWIYGLGLFGGIAIGLLILVLVLVSLIRWMKKRINTYRELHIDLPKNLDIPRLVTEPETNDPFNSFSRTDSFKNINREMMDDESDSFKNRHGSGLSHTSNSSTELLFKANSNQRADHLFRMTSHDSGQQESISSHYSTEAHMSSDSGVEVDQQVILDMQKLRTTPKPCLPIVDEMGLSDSSGSKDSGLDVNSGGARSKKTKKRLKNTSVKVNNKISSLVMPTNSRNEVTNPLYDTPMTHAVCVYSLLANSEPSLLELPVREDENILNDLKQFTKPEMAKSLSNIIQSYSPSDPKINCIICETNNSSRSSTRTSSPNCPYYKYGIKRQNHNQNSLVANFTPEKHREKVAKANNGYITIDSISSAGQPLAGVPPKKRLDHDWSQSSYDAEVSSTSSNGDNEQTDVSTHNNLFTKSRLSFNDCQKIQNNSSFEDNTELTELNVVDAAANPQTTPSVDSVTECETQLSVDKEVNTRDESPIKAQVKSSAKQLAKDSNGYVLHNAINQLTDNQVKPKLTKNANGYVIREGIEMNGLVPNSNVVNVTQV